DVSEESGLLEDLTSRVRKGDFELVHGSLITISSSVEEKTVAVVSEELKRAWDVLSRYADSPETAMAATSLQEAKEHLEKKDYQEAHDQIDAVTSELLAERRKNLDRTVQDGHTLLDMAKQLGAESVTLREKLQRAEELKAFGRMDEASLLAEEVVSYGRSIVSSEVDSKLTELMQRITVARKGGVEVGQAEHITEQGSTALHKDELESAFELTMNARRSLDEVVAAHQRLMERLEENESLIEAAKKADVDVKEAQEAVIHGGMLLRSGRYADATKELDRAQSALRRNASSFILSSKQKQMEDMAQLRDRLGLGGSEQRLQQLGPLDAGDLDGSLNALASLREEWEEEITTWLAQELTSCQKDIDKAVTAGSSVGHVQQILARGRSSLSERKLLEAMRAVELVRAELDNAVQADRRLNDALAMIDESLEQLKEMKADVRDATVLLEQARALRRTGQSSTSSDLAERALARCQAIARERITSLMGFAGGLTNERMNWEDLRTARKMNDDIEEALKNYRYRHAHLLARSFREELERVLQDKAQADEEMRRFETRLKEEMKLGLRPESLQKALEKAKVMVAQGRFVQALSSVSVARDELRALSEMYESRLHEYNLLRESLNSLEVLDPRKDRVEELLDQSWSALKEMQFEPASLYLRRAKNALNEFLTVRTNELLWEFNPLHDLIKRLKLQKKFSANIAEIERSSIDAVTARDLNRLSRSVELVKAGMRDIFEEQREKARTLIEKASRADKQTGRSWELWSESETQAANGDLWDAFNSLETAVNAIGRKGGDSPEVLSKQLSDMLDVANRHRVELRGTEKAYAEALALIKEGKNAMSQLRTACEISRKEVRATYPDIAAELQFVGEALEGRPMDVIVHLKNEAEYEARNVRAFIFGDVDVKGMVEAESLKAMAETEGRITIVPMKPGLLSLGISVKCKPLLTEEDVLYDSKFDLDVK
ncbi:MAG: hypothetical protein MIO90_03950, partial [Methanomassiliicoccales archaeon]|nr:hypothetical protein [Methanomassiliicoccales archaeon]